MQYNIAADGRVAIGHDFTQDDVEWLEAALEDEGVIFTDKLPENWK